MLHVNSDIAKKEHAAGLAIDDGQWLSDLSPVL
jgi:hypothetical protein